MADLFGYMPVLPGLSADGRADQILAAYVTGNYFTALKVQPALGRLIQPSEENQPGKTAVLVLGYSYWQKRFRGDPGVIGKLVRLNGKPAIVVGVVPKVYRHYVAGGTGWLSAAQQRRIPRARTGRYHERSRFPGDARDGTAETRRQLHPAQSSMNVIAARLAKQYPATDKTSRCAFIASSWRARSRKATI